MSETYDLIIHNANLASMAATKMAKENGRQDFSQQHLYGVIEDAVVCIKDKKISKIIANATAQSGELQATRVIDAGKRWMTPGLIDCHTHLVYAGNRADEYAMRLQGASYQQIAEAGGGIIATVKATRTASKQQLFDQASKRLSYLIDEGVTTLEIKSGYGLDVANEQKILEVIEELHKYSPVTISKTFLGAHAAPPEYKNNADEYIQLVCEQMLPQFKQLGLIDCVDVFCEGIGFTLEQTRKVFNQAQTLNLPVKLHAEQLSDLGSSRLASEFSAWSVDHLEYLNPADIPLLKQSNTVATLLPGAFYFLRETKLPPIKELVKHQVPIAIATDSNPGSSPCLSLLTMLNMATTLFNLTPAQALQGVTINAAKALRMQQQIGSIEVGKNADLALWDIQSPAELSYRIGGNPCVAVIKNGEIVLAKTNIQDG